MKNREKRTSTYSDTLTGSTESQVFPITVIRFANHEKSIGVKTLNHRLNQFKWKNVTSSNI